jgi:ATP synthase protein I
MNSVIALPSDPPAILVGAARRKPGTMQDDPFRERLKRLEERIEAAQKPKADTGRGRGSVDGSALGWRMVTELLAGIALGLALGYGLDSLLGTLPLFLVVFVLLGFAAGVRTMMRSADELKRQGAAARAARDAVADRSGRTTATAARDEIAAVAAEAAGGKPVGNGDGAPGGRPRD